ncbi:glycoside hydrolase family 3 N-terminal domain-containing protein, partial [Enterococcus avium]
TLEELMAEDFVPFLEGGRAGARFIMSGHIAAPAVTGDNTPASMSPKMITEILRGTLGYDGIIITDALNMGAVNSSYSSADAAVRALQAGNDMLLMPENFQEAYQGVLTAVENGTLLEERINQSVERILKVKFH